MTYFQPPVEIVRYGPSSRVSEQIKLVEEYRKPRPDQITRLEFIRALTKDVMHVLGQLCPDSRELSLALTSVEDAQHWANSAIIRHEPTAELADDA